ncbi:MAG: thiamine pyrophosphate-dependent enzyme, partial [Methanobrevibacter boviskoreani]
MDIPKEELFAPGHRGCAGCGAAIGARLALKASGKNTVAICATGCLEVMTTPYPETAWRVPFVHVAFENAGAVASGVERALKSQGKEDTHVIAFGGDGGSVDIGLQSISGAMERGHNITYICYDNEAYMNTGIQ